MKEITDYIIVSNTSYRKLAEEVQKLIRQGFQPFEGLAVVYVKEEEALCLFQAMVKMSAPQPLTIPQ